MREKFRLVLAARLRALTAGKPRDELMFRQTNGSPWVKSAQQPRMRAALKAAGIRRHVRSMIRPLDQAPHLSLRRTRPLLQHGELSLADLRAD